MPAARTDRSLTLLVSVLAASLGAAPVATAAPPAPGALTPDRVKLPSGPGSIRGLAAEPEVDPFYGQVKYEVPIDLPAGLGALAPKLSLSYTGVLGNGPLGIGWSLPSVRIARSTRLGQPRFDASDELEVSGIASGRLVPIGGGEYRLEASGQTVRIKHIGGGFEIQDGSGTTYRLGVSQEARHASGTRVQAWLVDDVENQAGERIRYRYLQDQGEVYLREVLWGPNEVFRAELIYEDRADPVVSYRGGFRVVTRKRLAHVRTWVSGVERRAYHFRYDDRFVVTRLAGVSSTGRGGSGEWPALTFEYGSARSPVVESIAGIGSWRLNVSGTVLADIDADGAADLIQIDEGGHALRRNEDGVFAAPVTMTGNQLPLSTVQLMDLDGDAKVELVVDTGDGWTVWRPVRTQWVAGGTWPGTSGLALKNPARTRFADLDGDNLIDALKWDNDGLYVYRASRQGFAPPRAIPKIGGVALPTDRGRFADGNGDGLDDYFELGLDGYDVYVGRGDGTFEAPVHVAYPWTGGIANRDDLHLVDLNRDGVVDLVKVDLGDVSWYPGRPNGTFAPRVHVSNPETHSNDVVVTTQDSNGNGSIDLVWSSAAGMWRLDLAGATTAGMLVRVHNGLGLSTSFAYHSSHTLSVLAARASEPWQYLVPMAIPVPVEQVTELGAGETTRRISYSVRDGMWDADERRFAGFLSSIVTTWGATPAETSSILTRYHLGVGDKRVLRGKPINEQVRDGTGKRLRLTVNTWEALRVDGLPELPLLRVAALTQVQTRYEDAAELRESKVVYQYDALGRRVKTFDHGRIDLRGDESYEEIVYGDDAITGVRNQTVEQISRGLVYDTSGVAQPGALVRRVRHLYGDDQTIHPVGVIGRGWVRETWAYLEDVSGGRWVRKLRTDYDPRGNPITVIGSGVTRHIAYDPSGLFPTAETIPVGGRDLVWRTEWDPVFGVPTVYTDANGRAIRLRYDALGRIVGVASGVQPEHLVYAYDWTGPFPKTYTYQFDGDPDALIAFAGWTANGAWRESVEVGNGRGEIRYTAVRSALDQWIITGYRERDPNSRVTFVGDAVYASSLQLIARPTGMIGQTVVYDPLGRVIRQELPTGSRRVFTHSAFEHTVQQDDLAQVRNILDGQGRIVRTVRTGGGTTETADTSYDPGGRIVSISLEGGKAVHRFRYDTLGNLVFAEDPDIGPRHLRYDDDGRLIGETNGAGQVTTYAYDPGSRLIERLGSDGTVFRFHYDAARAGFAGENLASRLAWVEEPTGALELSYDVFGNEVRARRSIDGKVAELRTLFAPSGLVRRHDYDDGFSVGYQYDRAGRLVGAGDLWQLVRQDAAGRVLEERFGNGVGQTYVRDVLGLVEQAKVLRPDGNALHDIEIDRTIWGGTARVFDRDGTGLDHSATFTYDAQLRLTEAVLGHGTEAYKFAYGYDALQNMVRRDALGPKAIGLLAGDYRYGENGMGPRQLSRAIGSDGLAHTFAYDAAGRQVAQDTLRMTYNGLDQLVRIDGIPGVGSGTVQHAYGYDGLRIKTIDPHGAATYWFANGLLERNGVREHHVQIGARTIARVAMAPEPSARTPAAQVTGGTRIDSALRILAIAVSLALLLFVMIGRPRRRLVRVVAALATGAVLGLACGAGSTAHIEQKAWSVRRIVYFHHTVGVGPTLFTDATGALLEERRYEPFGAGLDAYRKTSHGYVVESVDFSDLDTNILNKQSDAATGWSYHGARWMVPETGRWLTPDPPVKAPDPKFVAMPWGMHPYQYVEQNPILYWDPDGREPDSPTADIRAAEDFEETHPEIRKVFANARPGQFNWISPVAAYIVINGMKAVFCLGGCSDAGEGGEPHISNTEAAKNVAVDVATGKIIGSVFKWLRGRFGDAPTPDPHKLYSTRELMRRVDEPGPFHNFPGSFDQQIFEHGTRTVTPNFWRTAKPGLSNDSVMYRLRGTVNGVEGTFEIGVRPSVSGKTEVIMHRFFRPDP